MEMCEFLEHEFHVGIFLALQVKGIHISSVVVDGSAAVGIRATFKNRKFF